MEMEDKEMPCTTLSLKSVVVDEGATAATAAGAPTRTTTTAIQQQQEGEAVTGANEEVRQVYATEEQIRAVFSNRLIGHNIMSYLNFGDMKAARQVSRSFLEMIEGMKRFKESQVLLLTDWKSHESKMDFLVDSDRIWRGIKINISLLSGSMTDIPRHTLKNVEFVSLVSEELWGDDPAPVCTIRDILKSTQKISYLKMDIQLITRNLKDVFRHSTVKWNLRNVKHFEILYFEKTFVNNNYIYSLGSDDVSEADYHSFANNLLYLGKAGILRRLESLRLLKMSFVGHGGRKRRFTRALMELLRRNLGTLRKVSLHLDVWESDDIQTMIFPHLHSLTAAVRIKGQDRLRDFLVNHPSLEELDVAVEKKFGKGLFDVIKQRSVNLTTFHFRATNFVDLGGMEGTDVDWTFLGEMKRLIDFAIVRRTRRCANWDTYGNGTRLLECLPKNQLERLRFRGIGADHCGFWRLNDFEQENVFDRDPEPELSYKLELLSGFRNLKCLSFRCCPDAVDDDIMRFIVTEMNSLEEMEISDCSRLTDVGIGGNSEDGSDSSDSIRNLKGLKMFSIRYSPLVTPDRLLSCLKLPFLRQFDYVGKDRVQKSYVVGIISQNTSLESLSINMEYSRDRELEEVEAEVKREINNPRLQLYNKLD